MLKIHSFFKRFYKLIKSISKKSYRTCSIISTGVLVVAIVALSSKDFGGSGKNRMVTIDSNTEISETESETEEIMALAANNETVQASIEEVSTNEALLTSSNYNSNVEINITQEDYAVLCQIVQAEAGGEDEMGKILVANVIINRVKSDIFPDTITEVVYDNRFGVQFQPTQYSSFNATVASDATKASVDRALAGEDYSNGALYFAVQTSSSSWFNTKLLFLFEYSGHYFYM